jgi:hypothetical protein
MIKIDYRHEGDMTDDEYSDQEDQEFIVTKEMLMKLVKENVKFPEGRHLCEANFFVK